MTVNINADKSLTYFKFDTNCELKTHHLNLKIKPQFHSSYLCQLGNETNVS